MKWIRDNSLWLLLNGFALVVMASILKLSDPYGVTFQNPMFENSAKWAVRFLLFSLAMSPANTYFGWRWAVKLRKSAGLWAFAFGALHFWLYLNNRYSGLTLETLILQPVYIFMGLGALTILAAMTLTSHRWAQRWLGKNWKRLHRLVYVAGVLIAAHAILAFSNSKKSFLEGHEALRIELIIYALIMAVLLIVRLPFVRSLLKPSRGKKSQTTGEATNPALNA